ncbi:3384_t:CDS:2 [Dentiscutata heterogama]|uniref:3384_t:CDS:1 n=1 Tax=Dentiscutata heterogama TaxID=1316150 RepID=A0ACA9KGU5_9GLOM|nr:3384_t:CDS:2 [Dentiscutata heterogama]
MYKLAYTEIGKTKYCLGLDRIQNIFTGFIKTRPGAVHSEDIIKV